jgi:uncharacterized Zn-finger protein
MSATLDRKEIVVTAADLPLHCPLPSMKLWNGHPRVFIDVETEGRAQCPYCGTMYRLDGPARRGH